MKRLLTLVAFFATVQASAQQVNPVPDYVFRNQMSVGRGTVTDTAAYFSIGPRYGATKGFMPPIVGDTATFSSGKRNGLLIFSVQKNKFLYWDSVRVQWSDMAGSSGSYIVAGDTSAMLAPYLRKVDTTSMLTAYLRKGDTASMLSPYYRSATASAALALKLNISDTSSMLGNYVRHAGYGLTKSGQSFLVDTLNISTRAWRQKGIDSLAALEVSGSGTTNYVAKFTAGSTIGNSQIFDNGTNVGVGTTSPVTRLDVLTSSTNGIDLRNLATSVGDQVAKSSPRFRLVSSRYEGGNVDAPFSFQNVRSTSATNDQRLAITNFGDVEVLSITNLGFVGIGTTSPNERMTIQGSASAGAAITLRGNNATSSNEMLIGQGNANESYVYNRANQPMIFGTNNTERLRIFANGRVFVGSSPTDAGYQLDINGTLRSVNGANFATTSGEVLIGTTTDAGDYKLQVEGNARIGTGKLDIASNTVYGLGVARSGTSEVAGQIYNSNGILYLGAESSAGGQIFSGSSAYAAVIGSGANYPLQFAVNNITRGGFSTSGNLLLGFTTDSYFLKLQVNGSIFSNNQFFGQGANAQLSIDSSTNISPLYVSAHSLTGTSAQAMLYSNTTWNTTGNPSLLDLNITNTASGATSNYIKITDGTNTFRVTKAAEVVTAAPSGGSIKPWKLGEAATVSPTSPNRTIRVEIDGTVYYLHAKTTND